MNADLILRAIDQMQQQLDEFKRLLQQESAQKQQINVSVDPDASGFKLEESQQFANEENSKQEPFVDREQSFDYNSFKQYINDTLKQYNYNGSSDQWD